MGVSAFISGIEVAGYRCRQNRAVEVMRLSDQAEDRNCAHALSRRAVLGGFIGTALFGFSTDHVSAKPLNPDFPDKETKYIPKGFPVNDDGPKPTLNSSKKVEKIENFDYQDIVVGTGKEVTKGCLAVAHWAVTLDNGLEVMNTRVDGKPVYFRVGSGQVEKGVDVAIVGMKVGGKRKIRALSVDAFSDIVTGERSSIPSDATVYIDVEAYAVDPYGR